MIAENRLRSEGIRLGYDEHTVIEDLSLSVPDGKITTIIGPNGCGKSTLLKALSRLKKTDRGSVILDGQMIHHLPTRDVAKRLGLLSQTSTAPNGITVEDLVRRGRYPHQSFFQPPSSHDLDVTEAAMARAGVLELRKRPVDQLSGGQRQRAWIAMVLAQETPLLLLDEPTTYLDLANELHVIDLVKQLNEEDGRTFVMVLHDINEAARISDHIVAMKAGRILHAGAPAEILDSQVLQELFGVSCDVMHHPVGDKPMALPRSAAFKPRPILEMERDLIEVKQLHVGYGERAVISDVSLRVPAGAITVVIGPNACGKSTLLRTCGRLLKPKGGAVHLEGDSIQKGTHKALSRRLAMMSQGPIVPGGFVVEDLVATGRVPHQGFLRQWRREDEEVVERSLIHCDLCKLRHREVDTLSGGQRQRAWFGMALAQDTPVLLLDEPTTFLDMAAQIDLLDLVHQMNRTQGRTIVMILHDLNLAARYADNIVAMCDGAVIASGAPKDVITVELLRDVFGVNATITTDPVAGSPVVMVHSAVAEHVPDGQPYAVADFASSGVMP